MNISPLRILYVDDYPLDRALVRDSLTHAWENVDLYEAASRHDFMDLLNTRSYDIVLSDFNILGYTGLQVLEAVQERLPGTPVIIVTGTGSEEVAAEAIKRGAADYVIKSSDHIRRLPHIIETALEQKQLREERARTEAALRESQRMLSTLMSNLPGMAYRCLNIPQWTMLFVSDGCHELTGYPPEEMVGDARVSYADIMHEDDRERVWTSVQSALAEGRTFTLTYRIVTAQGETKWVWERGRGVQLSPGSPEVLEGFISDITERVQAEDKLRQCGEELRMLTLRLAEAEETERHRLARELHDQVGQSLAVLSFNLNIVKGELLENFSKEVAAGMDASIHMVAEVTQGIRNVMDDLRPSVLDDYGLFAALNWYADRYSDQTGVAAQVQGADLQGRLPANVENALFRITQEALTNVSRHASAKKVIILLTDEKDTFSLQIQDDGEGFVLERSDGRRGWGLINMRERAEVLGASLEIESDLGHGTTITVLIPKEGK